MMLTILYGRAMGKVNYAHIGIMTKYRTAVLWKVN